MTNELEREKWERMRGLHEQYESLRAIAVKEKIAFKEDSGTAERLLTVFGPGGSHDNAWWTTWRPSEEEEA